MPSTRPVLSSSTDRGCPGSAARTTRTMASIAGHQDSQRRAAHALSNGVRSSTSSRSSLSSAAEQVRTRPRGCMRAQIVVPSPTGQGRSSIHAKPARTATAFSSMITSAPDLGEAQSTQSVPAGQKITCCPAIVSIRDPFPPSCRTHPQFSRGFGAMRGGTPQCATAMVPGGGAVIRSRLPVARPEQDSHQG